MSDAFALDNFAPPDTVTFRLRKHGDHEFVVDADPDTADVLQMLRIEETIRTADGELDTVTAADEGKQLLLRLIQERQPEIVDLKAGMQEVLIVFSLIVRGSNVATAVANAISAAGGDEPPDKAGDGGAVEGTDDDAAPLASGKRSRARSSSSDTEDAGLQAIGTA